MILTLKNIAKMNKNILQFFFISSGDDPVGDKGKGVERAYDAFMKAGVKDITMKLYPGARHELMLELNHKNVFSDIMDWINSRLN